MPCKYLGGKERRIECRMNECKKCGHNKIILKKRERTKREKWIDVFTEDFSPSQNKKKEFINGREFV